MIPAIETQIGTGLARIVDDRGYRGHNASPDHKFNAYISGQRRRITETIKRELRTAFVQPTNGETVWYLSDGVSKPFFKKLLADFAETVEAGRKRRIVLVFDYAGCMTRRA